MCKNRLKEKRTAQGWTQTDLALKAEVDQRTISAYETGAIEPSMVNALKIARIFGCSVEDIWFLPPANVLSS